MPTRRAKPQSPGSLHLIEHPLLLHLLTEARDRATPPARFRELLGQLGQHLGYEVLRDLPTEPRTIHTPLEPFEGVRLALPLTIVPILRAGLGMAEGLQRLLPEAKVGHIGMFRDEQKLAPVSYYQKLPLGVAGGMVLLVDPMLATGGSAMAAVELLHSRGCRRIRVLCIVAAPEGVERFIAACPGVPIYAAALDRELDDRGFILPGMGDAGDRLFGTTQ